MEKVRKYYNRALQGRQMSVYLHLGWQDCRAPMAQAQKRPVTVLARGQLELKLKRELHHSSGLGSLNLAEIR